MTSGYPADAEIWHMCDGEEGLPSEHVYLTYQTGHGTCLRNAADPNLTMNVICEVEGKAASHGSKNLSTKRPFVCFM